MMYGEESQSHAVKGWTDYIVHPYACWHTRMRIGHNVNKLSARTAGQPHAYFVKKPTKLFKGPFG
jgi:hypothetical protein